MRAELKILIIDDEVSITNTVRRSLRMDGFENVETAVNYKEAMAYINREMPQIVISDINLPDGDGLTILKETKSLAPLTQVIMLTGKGDQEKVITALESGASDFLRKPMDMKELRSIVKVSIERVKRWAELYEDLIMEGLKK
jgi:DNA-binding response OmpR family regulator